MWRVIAVNKYVKSQIFITPCCIAILHSAFLIGVGNKMLVIRLIQVEYYYIGWLDNYI